MSCSFTRQQSCIQRIKSILVEILLVGCLFFFGCLPGPLIVDTEDVSSEKQLWNDYRYHGIYKLKVDVFWRIREDVPTPNKSVLVPPREKTKGIYNLLYSAPQSISDYQKDQVKWPDVRGVVAADTRIQCTRLIKYNPVGYESSLYIYARILDGPYSGKEVEISDLSLTTLDPKSDLYLLSPNFNLLSLSE